MITVAYCGGPADGMTEDFPMVEPESERLRFYRLDGGPVALYVMIKDGGLPSRDDQGRYRYGYVEELETVA